MRFGGHRYFTDPRGSGAGGMIQHDFYCDVGDASVTNIVGGDST
jgi:hypothetical protein